MRIPCRVEKEAPHSLYNSPLYSHLRLPSIVSHSLPSLLLGHVPLLILFWPLSLAQPFSLSLHLCSWFLFYSASKGVYS